MPATRPISITYAVADPASATAPPPPVTETFDYLIVACDPRGVPLADRTDLEREVVDRLVSYTFRTSLLKSRRPSVGGDPKYAVRFNPTEQLKMDGSIYAFRDEVMARRQAPSSNGVSWCTVYQFAGAGLYGEDVSAVEKRMDAKRDTTISSTAENDAWLDFTPLEGVEEKALVDYFPHFEKEDLRRELPWLVRDAQGENNTFYVASFTCFESVLHCYLYGQHLMDRDGKVMKEGRFPKNKNASFAVLGAGPSGILFASQQLQRRGYKNFKIFEKDSRFGGKCLTYPKKAPADPEGTPREDYIPCELGTCYLSPAYEPMFDLFEEYDAGRIESLEKGSKSFRGVVDGKVANNADERMNGVEYGAWTTRAVADNRFIPNDLESRLISVRVALAGAKYSALHYAIMGTSMNDAMPDKPPTRTSALQNIRDLIKEAREKDDEKASTSSRRVGSAHLTPDHTKGKQVKATSVYSVLCEKNAKVRKAEQKRDFAFRPRGLFDSIGDIGETLSGALAAVQSAVDSDEKIEGIGFFEEQDMEKAADDVFSLSFLDFLKKHDMMALYPRFVYGYQVQGYGTIATIPAYYGLIWITPGSMLKEIRDFLNPPEPGSVRDRISTVNIVDRGWLTLFEKMVERDIAPEKLVLNANIQTVRRGPFKARRKLFSRCR